MTVKAGFWTPAPEHVREDHRQTLVTRGYHASSAAPLLYPPGSETPRGLYLVCLLAHCQGTGYLGSASTVHHTVVTDEVPDDTQCVVKGSFCFLDDLGKTVLPKLLLSQCICLRVSYLHTDLI